ncbi:MAG: hypothetical protein Q9N26_00795 [Aquificota bacterium]|nr:hypothetical protein [Aquificota bacterium]
MNFRVILPGGRTGWFRWSGEGKEPDVGWRVLVQGRSGGVTGIVVGRGEGEPEGDILAVPDEGPLVLPHHMDLVDDLSRDYLLPKGVVLFRLLPSVFDWYEEEFVRASGKVLEGLDRKSREVLGYVMSRKEVRADTLKRRFGSSVVSFLIGKGFLVKERKWVVPDLRVRLYTLNVPLQEALKRVKDPRKRDLLLKLAEMGEMDEDTLRDLGVSKRTLTSLVKKGVLKETIRETEAPRRCGPQRILAEVPERGEVLWGDLDRVVERVGSLCLSAEGSALILFPGSELLGRTIHRFREMLGDRIVEIHSAVGTRKMVEGWFSCLKGNRVVLGTFIALLAPLPDLRVVVVMDETSAGVRIPVIGVDLRRAVLILARRTGSIPVITAPAPSVSSYYLTVQGKMAPRGMTSHTPEVRVFQKAPSDVLTGETVSEIKDEESVLFLVRKEGYSYAYCPRCETVTRCPNCGTFLTLSLSKNLLYCTGCRKFRTADLLCPDCGGEVGDTGLGVERAVEVVERTLGLKEGFRFSTHPPWGETYGAVVVLSADSILSLPTFRAEEEFFLYLMKACVCAERKVIVQTSFPDITPVRCLADGKPEEFYRYEIERRLSEKLPPCYRLVLVRSRRDLGGYIRKVVSQEVKTFVREGYYDHLIRFSDRRTLLKVADLKKRFGKDIIEVRVDPL